MHRRAIRLGAAAFLIGLGARLDACAAADAWSMLGVRGFVVAIILGVLSLLLLGVMLRALAPVMPIRGAPRRSWRPSRATRRPGY